jgi:hypothetical protein
MRRSVFPIRISLVAMVVTSSFLGSCDRSSRLAAGDMSEGEMITAAGDRSPQSHDPPGSDGASAPQWTPVRDLTVGTEDGDAALTHVTWLTVDEDGNVYAAQPRESLVRVFTSDGAFLRVIGRGGGGPGEFRAPSRLGWRADTLWVADPLAGRISLFGNEGVFLRALSFMTECPGTSERPCSPTAMFSDGSFLGQRQLFTRTLAEADSLSEPLVRFTATAEVGNVLAHRVRRNEFARLQDGTATSYRGEPFTDTDLFEIFPRSDGLVLVSRPAAASAGDARFTVRVIEPSGGVLFVREHSYSPQRLSDAAFSRVISGGGSEADRANTRADQRSDHFYRPEFLPPVTALVLGRDGTIWLRRERTGEPTIRWDVIDRGGRMVGYLYLPSALAVKYADRAQIWAVERDEWDVTRLVRFRVNR